MKKLRWGILGCANIAKRAMIPGIHASETGEVVAIASRSLDTAQNTAAELNIPTAYGSYEELLIDPNVDAVYIPLPNHLHKPWTIRAAENNKHVLCEKPLGLSSQEAEEMVAKCAHHGVRLAEAMMYRYHPRYNKMLTMIQAGEIGELRGIHSTFTFNSAGDAGNVRFRKDWGGGGIYDVGVYPISAARFILGCEPEAVTVRALFSPEHGGVDMMASGMIEFPGEMMLTFDCGMWADFRNTLEILGTHGRIEVPNAFIGEQNFYVHVNGERREEVVPQLDTYALQADDFARTVWGEKPSYFTAYDAILNMRVIDACLKSATERCRVQMNE